MSDPHDDSAFEPDPQIGDLVADLVNARGVVAVDDAWAALRDYGDRLAPYFLAAYRRATKAEARRHLVYYATDWARRSDDAFQLGLDALEDRSSIVRYRACGLLAYSLRPEAVPPLSELLGHPDEKTSEDAAAAMKAIEQQNINLWVDRRGTGRVFWEVGDTPRPPVPRLNVQRSTVQPRPIRSDVDYVDDSFIYSERFAPITWQFGFVHVPLDDAVEAFVEWRRRRHPSTTATRLDARLPDSFLSLEPFEVGARERELLVEAGEWTARFATAPHGPDAVSPMSGFSHLSSALTVAVKLKPPVVRDGFRSGGAAIHINDPEEDESRVISATMHGGNWSFWQRGPIHDFEEPDAYASRLVRERLTPAMIQRYCRALGIDILNPNFYGRCVVLDNQSSQLSRERLTLDQVQERLGVMTSPQSTRRDPRAER